MHAAAMRLNNVPDDEQAHPDAAIGVALVNASRPLQRLKNHSQLLGWNWHAIVMDLEDERAHVRTGPDSHGTSLNAVLQRIDHEVFDHLCKPVWVPFTLRIFGLKRVLNPTRVAGLQFREHI